MQILVDQKGHWKETVKYNHYPERRETIKEEIGKEFEGEIVEEYLLKIEKTLETPEIINRYMSEDLLIRTLFLGYCINYGKDLTAEKHVTFPIIDTGYLFKPGNRGNEWRYVMVDVFRQVKGGDRAKDQHICTYTLVKVIDGEINLEIGNTYAWYAKIAKPSSIEEFYVKVKAASGKYVSNGKDTIHACFLRMKNAIVSRKIETTNNNTPVVVGQTDKFHERIGFAVVYFRPLDSWNGEYGFDWLREKDNGLATANDPAYADIIEGGYKDGISDLTGGPTGTAYAQLKTQ